MAVRPDQYGLYVITVRVEKDVYDWLRLVGFERNVSHNEVAKTVLLEEYERERKQG